MQDTNDRGYPDTTTSAPLPPRPVKHWLTGRVPAWTLAFVAAVVAAGLGTVLILQVRAEVHLGPAVGAAQRVAVQITLCNRDVDRLKINPREAELHLEGELRHRGAKAANVVVERQDCPSDQVAKPAP